MGGVGGLSCGAKMAKFFLFLFNIIFWLIGAIVLGVGIWVLADKRALELMMIASVDSSDSLVKGAAITFIVIGLIIFITGFFGCWGAIKENACMLLMYAIIVGFVLVLQVVAGIMGAVYKDQILDTLESSMNKTVKEKYGQTDQDGITNAFDFVQKEFKCCGATGGPSDWTNTKWSKNKNTTDVVPQSCCPMVDDIVTNNTLCQKAAATPGMSKRDDYVWTKGCKGQLEDWVEEHSSLLIGVAFGLAAVQLFGVMLACCLRSAIKKGYEYV